jgi:hypothetical protein
VEKNYTVVCSERPKATKIFRKTPDDNNPITWTREKLIHEKHESKIS